MIGEFFRILFAVLVFPGGLFAIALGLLLKGVERRLVARLQRRIGAPLLQPFYDLVKLMGKITFVPDLADTNVFLMTPLIGVASMSLAMAMLPIAGVYAPSPMLGDLLVLFYVISLPALSLMLAGSASGSPFGAIGFSREMALMLAYEGPILLVIVSVALHVGAASGRGPMFSLAEIVQYQIRHGPLILDWRMVPAALAYAAFIPANLGMPPFDIAEAETELLEGPLLEYTGASLGLLKLASAIKTVAIAGLGVALFFPNGPGGVLGVVAFAAKCLVIVGCLSVLKAAVGRMRIDQAVVFYLRWPVLFGVLSLAMVAIHV
ncbi:respiratory chain complex I subunit 1 family protein [Caulobacter sp. S45]|uniref:respiratory chain complex I subunit 1 family protein n=1 Tax=Caulobacter sp. S45 TaxID=1641861 RepID=UPI001C20B523|nr:complex I subunit 1 family protein [Caulobacter sp. S45]